MSISSAMLAGVSGLSANSSALAAISNNISNANTTGYKRVQVEFQTLVTGANNAGADAGGYSAGGVMGTNHYLNSVKGLLQRSTSNKDLSIDGGGFFVTTEKASDVGSTDTRLFTRAGSFRVDEFGFLRNTAGLYLQGWPANNIGEITIDPSDVNNLKSINISSVGGSAEATTLVGVNANLKSSQTIAAAAGGAVGSGGTVTYLPTVAATSMAAYDPSAGTGIKPDFEIQIPISDSKGGRRTITMGLLKSQVANEWYAEVYSKDFSSTNTPPNRIAFGAVKFTPDGKLDIPAAVTSTYAGGGAATSLFGAGANRLTLNASGQPQLLIGASAPADATLRWKNDLGVGAQTVALDLKAVGGGLTQLDSPSVTQLVTPNGTAFGNLTDVEIGKDGIVTAIYDNGVTRRLGQVAVATFANPDGLGSVSGNAFVVTRESGTYNLKAPGTGGAGFLAPSTLESSTVDLSTEFTGLITTQRAYSASSKIITTADEMLSELINIKR
ncbi:MAG: flagellar hook-basal body complex protein [Asticcacaulis sp.]